MNISSVNANYLPGSLSSNQSAGVDAKIRSLEQKLQQLNQDREKAVQRRDEKEKRKLEEEIKEIEKQIQQLGQAGKKKTEEAGTETPKERPSDGQSSDGGEYMDIYG